MSIETWYARAALVGGAAVTATTYPISGGLSSVGKESAEFSLYEPTRERGNLGRPVFRQQIDLTLVTEESRAREMALEVLRLIADSVGFASGQRVEIKLSSVVNAPVGAPEPATKTLLVMSPVRMPSQLIGVSREYLEFLWGRVDDPHGKRGRQIVRAMRWLRRSAGAVDEVEEFTVLAFGLESIADLLPEPEAAWLRNLRRDQRPPRTAVADHSERLRYFACVVCGLKGSEWKTVGRPRHQLFHGGLTEDIETSRMLGAAIPTLRRVLVLAIKHVAGIPDDRAPIDIPISPFFGDVSLTFSGPIDFLQPSAVFHGRPPMLPEQVEDNVDPDSHES